MIKTWLVVSIGSLLLFGCTNVKYVKPGATQADFEADSVACRKQVPMAPIGPTYDSGQMGRPGVREGVTAQMAEQSAELEFEKCLQAKGWVPETQSK
jgi:hypothetical protein